MKEKAVPVGIFQKEIFIALYRDGKLYGFDVIRPVEANVLEELRDPDSYQEYCEDLWKGAVQAGATRLGLREYAEQCIDEADCLNDDEAFPGKDESGCENLTPELRKEADNYLMDECGVEVGTWECSGSFCPNSFYKNFKKFDYVFDNDAARKSAKDYYKKIAK